MRKALRAPAAPTGVCSLHYMRPRGVALLATGKHNSRRSFVPRVKARSSAAREAWLGCLWASWGQPPRSPSECLRWLCLPQVEP